MTSSLVCYRRRLCFEVICVRGYAHVDVVCFAHRSKFPQQCFTDVGFDVNITLTDAFQILTDVVVSWKYPNFFPCYLIDLLTDMLYKEINLIITCKLTNLISSNQMKKHDIKHRHNQLPLSI